MYLNPLAQGTVDTSFSWSKGKHTMQKDLFLLPNERQSQVQKASSQASTPWEDLGLTEEQLKYFSERYDFTCMTEKQYNQFLDELRELGILPPEEDIVELDASDMKLRGELACLDPYFTDGKENPVYLGFSSNYFLNVEEWVHFETTWKTMNPETGAWEPSEKAKYYQKLEQIIQAIQAA